MRRRAAIGVVLIGLWTAAGVAAPLPNTYEILVDASGALKYQDKTVDAEALQEALKQLFKEHPDASIVIRVPEGYDPAILQPPLQAALQAGFSDNVVPTTDSPNVDPTIAPAPSSPEPAAESKPPEGTQASSPKAPVVEKPYEIDLRTPGTMLYDGQPIDEDRLRENLTQLYAKKPNAAIVIYLSEGYDPSVLEGPLKWVTQTGFEDIAITTDAPGTAERSPGAAAPAAPQAANATENLKQDETPSKPEPPSIAVPAPPMEDTLPELEITLPTPDPARLLVYDTLLKAVAAGDLYATLGQLAAGQHIYERDDLGRDAFLLAAENGYDAILPYVHKAINHIETRDNLGNTALHLAAAQGQIRTIEWLVRHGADKEAWNKENLTPFLTAAKTGNAEALRNLFALGANPYVSCDPVRNCGALVLACREKHWNVTLMLHELGLHRDIHFAAASGDLGMVRTFLAEKPLMLEEEQLNGATPLLTAAMAGQAEVVRYLVEQGADLNAENFEGQCVMGAALVSGSTGTVESLVKAGLDLDAFIDRRTGDRPLHWVANNNRRDMAVFLLDLGAKTDEPDFAGERALHTAVTAGNKDIATLLLERGASVNIQRNDDCAPLHLAAELDRLELADLLAQHQANMHVENNQGETPLHRAAEKDRRGMVDWLLEHGARIDAVSRRGETALHIVARKGDTALVEDLAARGAPLEAAAISGFTPFLSAIDAGEWPAAEALLKLGVNRLQNDREGNTALHLAMEHQWLKLLPQFETLGIPCDAGNRKNRTPLFLALKTEQIDATEWLLAHGAAVDHVDCFGQTPLFAAAEQGGLRVTKRLLEAGADPNRVDQWGRTPMHYAARRGNPMLIKLLADAGGRIDIADIHGQLPIHFAANTGHWGAIQFQLLRGIEINAADLEGRTPLFFTMKNGFFMASRNLLRHGATFATHDGLGHTPIDMFQSFLDAYSPVLFAMPDPEKERFARYCTLQLYARNAWTEEAARNAELGKTASMEAFLSCYPTMVSRCFLGETPLHRAVRAGHLDIVRLLVKLGADVNMNAHTPEGYTPLHEAARNGHTEVAAYLIESGASPLQKAENGETPIETARAAGKEALFPKQ